MSKREVINVKGTSHNNPIPTAVKIKNMVYTSALIGSDAETGLIPESVDKEVANLFYYLEEIMRVAGGTSDDIAHIKILVSDLEYKKFINPHWLKMFPNDDNRPARHTEVRSLKEGVRVQIEMTAVL